jgi:hypothetical protein
VTELSDDLRAVRTYPRQRTEAAKGLYPGQFARLQGMDAEFDATLARIETAIEHLQGKWDDAADRCPQCGTGVRASPFVKALEAERDALVGAGLYAVDERDALEQRVKGLARALDTAGTRLAQVQPGVTEPWAFDIVPMAEREIAEALKGTDDDEPPFIRGVDGDEGLI